MAAEEGKKAPAFNLPASGGGKVALKEALAQGPVVLYFYPKDMTSGCTAEACGFRDAMGDLRKLGAVVLGVSPDSVESHEKFIAKEKLNFQLLADTDKKVSEAYGVWVEKSMYGRKYMGVERATFLIGRDGRIARAWRKVKVPGHVAEVAAAVEGLG
jgi:peroxiredoxin Q/BCP